MLVSPCELGLACEEGVEDELSPPALEPVAVFEGAGVVLVVPLGLPELGWLDVGWDAVGVVVPEALVDGLSPPLPHALTPTTSKPLANSVISDFISSASPFLH